MKKFENLSNPSTLKRYLLERGTKVSVNFSTSAHENVDCVSDVVTTLNSIKKRDKITFMNTQIEITRIYCTLTTQSVGI